MQARIAPRCFRGNKLFFFFHKAETMITNSNRVSFHHNPIVIPSRSFHSQTLRTCQSLPMFTRQLSTKRKPWEASRITPYLSKHVNAFLSDVPVRPSQDSVPNGHALFSTSTEGDAKPAARQEKSTTITKGDVSGEQITNTKILSTLARYLWTRDTVEFRWRVMAALSFLVGAKVLNVQVPFLFKLAVDWLTTATGNTSALAEFNVANSTALAVFVSPAAVLIGYGIARTGASAFNGTSP